MNHYLAINLKLLRGRSKRSASEVSGSINVNRSTYSGWENGASEPSLEHLIRLAEYHHLPIDVLVSCELGRWSVFELDRMRRIGRNLPVMP